jgi:hypothetical protein
MDAERLVKMENKKYSFKTVILTLVSTYLGAMVLTWQLLWPGIESFLTVLYVFPAVLLCFPAGFEYYIRHTGFPEALGDWSVLILSSLIYITLFILALCFRGKKVFITILIIWVALLILNIHGCVNGIDM